jgi:RND family efflux transporter MFP subunit
VAAALAAVLAVLCAGDSAVPEGPGMGAAAPGQGAPQPVEAVTRPSKDRTLSFTRPGLVAEALVTEGAQVKSGQLLVRLDDAAERANLEQLQAQASDTIRVRAADAELSQKEVELKKIKWAAERQAATELEVQHAELDVKIAELRLELAKFQRDQDQREYAEKKILLERMQLKSPIAGTVEEILVRKGESADALEKVIRVIQIDPLWIDTPVPLASARALRIGQPARVQFGSDTGKLVSGKIVHKRAVADAASDTLIVRVEAPNPSSRPAGERVWVSFPVEDCAAAGGGSRTEASAVR